MNRRHFIQQLAGASTAVAIANAAPQGQRLNFVFILADDLGWTDLSSYGSKFYETPNIDRLASQGVRFTNAYAACPVCSPTRASIMTGKYPARLGLTNYLPGVHPTPYSKLIGVESVQQLPLSEVTVAETLHDSGYRTGIFGKWHLGGEGFTPNKQGFDTTFLPAGGGNYFYPGWRSKNPPIDGHDGEYSTDRVTDEAIRFIDANQNQPFFLYLPHFAPHVPLQAKEEQIAKFKSKVKAGAGHNDPVYAAMIWSLDENVGRVLRTLDDRKIADRTVVIFVSDNGGLSAPEWLLKPTTSNSPLREGKGHVYEGGIRVPLIVRGPGVRKRVTENNPVSSIDFLPTIAQLAGANSPSNIDGKSFADLLKTGKTPPIRNLFWHYPHYSNQLGRPASAVRQGNYKLIRFHEDQHVELYDLSEDQGETKDLAKIHPDRTAQLTTILDGWLKETGAKMPTPNPQYDSARESDGYWWKKPGAYERFITK